MSLLDWTAGYGAETLEAVSLIVGDDGARTVDDLVDKFLPGAAFTYPGEIGIGSSTGLKYTYSFGIKDLTISGLDSFDSFTGLTATSPQTLQTTASVGKLSAEVTAYLSIEDAHPTDDECDWNYGDVQCEPTDICEYNYQFGDMTLGQSCRLKESEMRVGAWEFDGTIDASVDDVTVVIDATASMNSTLFHVDRFIVDSACAAYSAEAVSIQNFAVTIGDISDVDIHGFDGPLAQKGVDLLINLFKSQIENAIQNAAASSKDEINSAIADLLASSTTEPMPADCI